MLSTNDLKTWLHRDDLARRDKILVALSTFSSPCPVRAIRHRAYEAGLRIPDSWNASRLLSTSRGMAIRTPDGWELTAVGREHLETLGVTMVSPSIAEAGADLRKVLSKIQDVETRAFVTEAVTCYEYDLYRSAIVMSWIGAVSVLHKLVVTNHLQRFNAEAKRVNSRWKDAATSDDLTKMREAEFLDRIAALSLIGNDVKKSLRECLDRRNSCGHPNSLVIRGNTVAHHLDILLLNVFTKFQ